MRCAMRFSVLALAIVAGLALIEGAAAQSSDDNDRPGWGHGPWHMWGDEWGMMGAGMMGPGMMGPGMMGIGGHGMMSPMMFALVDANGDGAVSYDEMEAVHKRMFDLLDEDKDGQLTVEEMRHHRMRWWGEE